MIRNDADKLCDTSGSITGKKIKEIKTNTVQEIYIFGVKMIVFVS